MPVNRHISIRVSAFLLERLSRLAVVLSILISLNTHRSVSSLTGLINLQMACRNYKATLSNYTKYIDIVSKPDLIMQSSWGAFTENTWSTAVGFSIPCYSCTFVQVPYKIQFSALIIHKPGIRQENILTSLPPIKWCFLRRQGTCCGCLGIDSNGDERHEENASPITVASILLQHRRRSN